MLTFEGRKPSTKNIGLEGVGVELDKVGAIKVSLFGGIMCAVIACQSGAYVSIYCISTSHGLISIL